LCMIRSVAVGFLYIPKIQFLFTCSIDMSR
jgi:hypothetical protein